MGVGGVQEEIVMEDTMVGQEIIQDVSLAEMENLEKNLESLAKSL